MVKLRTLQTSKLFYKKWPYKIECWGRNFWMVKRFDIDKVVEYCQKRAKAGLNAYWDYKQLGAEDKGRLLAFTRAMEPYLDQDLQIRVEGNTYNIYCKDTALYNALKKDLREYIIEVHEPASMAEVDFLNDNGHKKVLCNKIPFNKYKYKVYFSPNCKPDVRARFESWIHNYNEKVRIPPGTVYWFVKGWRQSPYIYVEDSGTLAMIGLFMGQDVKKVEEHIPRSSININLDQDNTCQHLAKPLNLSTTSELPV